ncbi:hypothetical protein AAVH_26516 [Aphelenchoides avenae]|nr:hypothetical protein AAVH_26516 [Aphelenchus avenae]
MASATDPPKVRYRKFYSPRLGEVRRQSSVTELRHQPSGLLDGVSHQRQMSVEEQRKRMLGDGGGNEKRAEAVVLRRPSRLSRKSAREFFEKTANGVRRLSR